MRIGIRDGKHVKGERRSKTIAVSMSEKDYEKLQILSFNTKKSMAELLREGFYTTYKTEKERLGDLDQAPGFHRKWPKED